jgi:poly(hydroxyalkanoate) granule-associated protein
MDNKEAMNNGENGVQHLLLDGARKMLLVSLGAIMTAQDELNHMTERLVERGESAQEQSRKRVDDFVEERRKQAKKARKQAEKDFDKRMEGLLHRMNLPTRSEIRSLNTKITRLSKKVDELKQDTVH